MKNSCFLCFLLITAIACKQKTPSIKTPPAESHMTMIATTEKLQQVEMTIEGMMCAIGCAATIEKKLNAVEGVATAKVDFDSKKALIAFDAQQLNSIKIEKIIEGVGTAYSVSEIIPVD